MLYLSDESCTPSYLAGQALFYGRISNYNEILRKIVLKRNLRKTFITKLVPMLLRGNKQTMSFPKLHRRYSSCIDSESLKSQQQPSESSSKEKQEDKLRKGKKAEKMHLHQKAELFKMQSTICSHAGAWEQGNIVDMVFRR